MDEMSSVEFRKRYAKLTEATRVTVLGRTIGVWFPGVVDDSGVVSALSAEAANRGGEMVSILAPPDWEGMKRQAADIATRARAIAAEPNPYRRPITPAPKPGKR